MRGNLLKHLRQITLSPELRKSRSLRVTIYVVVTALLYLLFIGNVLPEQYNYEVGSIADKTIKAPIDAVDTLTTNKAREEARKSVARQFNKDTEVEERAYADINRYFESVKRISADPAMPLADKLSQLKQENLSSALDEEHQTKLLGVAPDQLPLLRTEATRIIQQVYVEEITDATIPAIDQKLDALVGLSALDRDGRIIVKELVRPLIRPNMIYDYEQTEKKRNEEAAAVQAVMINKGEIIVKEGERIDEEDLSKLRDLKMLNLEPNYRMYFGFAGFIAFWTLILAFYLELTGNKVGRNNLLLLCLGIVITFTATGLKVLSLGEAIGFMNIGYLTPVAIGTMLIAILFDAQIAILMSFLFAFLTGAAYDFKFEFIFISFIAGLVGTFAVSRVKHRMVIMRAGFIIAGINLLTISTMSALSSATGGEFSQYLQSLLFGIIGGVFSAVVTIGILPFLESSFGILTPISLLELSNPNHPLLKKLLMEAPGTYHHSLIVGNLAEAAAEMVGADPLLCRVGAYFHDVGKMKRPLFFIENQMSKENPHDKIAPSLSHLIITSHVRDGLEMQEEYRLPKPIRDICEQHHGTTVLWYFYNKALEQDKSGSVKIDDFRYAGPKPQSKEAALVMLCDAVEAAVRAMNRPTPNRIEAVIQKIFKDRLNDGQLDECDLNFKDLDKIAEAFLRTLNGIYHARIEYPEPPKAD